MRVKILSGYSCPHRRHLSVALQIQLLFQGGSAGFAVGRQRWTREGPTHPPGTLTLQTKVPYRGTAQPRLQPQGPGIPVALPEVQVGRDQLEGGGSSHNPGASQSLPGTPPSCPARAAGLPSSEQARGLAWGWDSPPKRQRDLRDQRLRPTGHASRALPIPAIRKSFCTTTRSRDIF